MSIWSVLELEPTSDVVAIRRAYARKLKVTQPEDDAEGFQRLRTAYETALKLAKQGAAASISVTVTVQPEPATPPPQPPPPERDPELGELETRFRALQAALQVGQAPSLDELRNRLQAVTESSALGNLSIFHTLETMLAALLAATVPRSDPLIADCIARFNWQQHENSLTPNPAIRIVLQRQHELNFLDDLESGRNLHARAFAHLRKRTVPFIRWWRAYKIDPMHSRELELLALIRDRYPRLGELLDPVEVQWWQRFASRPRVSHAMTRLAAFATVLAAIFGSFAGAQDGFVLKTGAIAALITAGVSTALILAKLYIIDWPTRLFAQRWPHRVTFFVRLGWLPITLGTLLLASILPMHMVVAALVGVSVIACALWAIYAAGPIPSAVSQGHIHLQNSHVAQALTVNFILAVWWMIAMQEWSDLTWNQYTLATLGAMAIAIFGHKPLVDFWVFRLSHEQKQLRLALLALTILLVGSLVWTTASIKWMQPLNTALVVSMVLLHRAPRGPITQKLYYGQISVLVVGGIVLQAIHETMPSPYTWPLTTMGSFLMLGSALINLMVTAYYATRT